MKVRTIKPDDPMVCHVHDLGFIDSILSKLPEAFRKHVKSTYSYIYVNRGRQAANLHLLKVEAYTKDKTLLIHGDDDIKNKAERLSKTCKIFDLDKAEKYLSSVGLALPVGETEQSILARVACPVWWERALRTKQDREQEQLAIQLGFVRKNWQAYCSTALLNRVIARQKRAMEIMKGMEAVSDEGDVLNMWDVLEKSIANPAVRRTELMVRMRGFENHATEQQHKAMFYTITCPSKYHRFSGKEFNDKYGDYTPKQAQEYLVSVWACIRAKLKRDGINIYGFRVAEPHHDGCPHWHLVLFMEPYNVKAVTEIMRGYALQEDGNEKGADKHRFEVVDIQEEKGSATGYIAKYISKNIDGFGMAEEEDDETGGGINEAAQRVRAWASVWGIRQFQMIGGAPVGVWRELRRLESAPDGLLEAARRAADAGDWSQYLNLQGGADRDRKEQPLKVFTVEQTSEETGEIQLNRYGEITEQVKGVVHCGAAYVETRLKVWTIQRSEDHDPMSEVLGNYLENPDFIKSVLDDAVTGYNSPSAESDFLQAGGFSAFPWSSVNNCTQPHQSGLEVAA